MKKSNILVNFVILVLLGVGTYLLIGKIGIFKDLEIKDSSNEIVDIKPGITKTNESIDVSLFYSKSGEECSPSNVIYSQIPKSEFTIEGIVNLLLTNKLTDGQMKEGYLNEFADQGNKKMDGFKLLSAEMSETGVVTLTFEDPNFFTSSGSCRVGMMVDQIKKTVMQYPGVTDVVIMPEDIFQP